MDRFEISLNPGIRPTQFKFYYNFEKREWVVWQYDERNEIDLIGGFHAWPLIADSSIGKISGNLITTLRLESSQSPTIFKLYYDPMLDQWKVWQRNEDKGHDLLGQFTIWPPTT